jgi:hypothetical protein
VSDGYGLDAVGHCRNRNRHPINQEQSMPESEGPVRPMITAAHREQIEQVWKGRVKALGYKPKSKSYAVAEVEFFVGAIATLNVLNLEAPPIWIVNIMSGRPVVSQ